jgi:hypothetical protein
MSNSYIDKYQQMENAASSYMDDINTLTNELNAMAQYMNQFDLAEVQSAIGDVNVAAFEGIRVDQVCELIADEQAQKALQNYISVVTELTRDVENGYDIHVNVNMTDLISDLNKKKEEIYAIVASAADSNMLWMADTCRWGAAMSAEKDDISYANLAVANVLHDAMVSQGIQKDVSAQNAAENINSMLLGFQYAMQHGAVLDEKAMSEQLYNAIVVHYAQAVKDGDDVVQMAVEITEKTEQTVKDSGLPKELLETVVKANIECLEKVGGHDLVQKYQDAIISNSKLEESIAVLDGLVTARSSEHENETTVVAGKEIDNELDI